MEEKQIVTIDLGTRKLGLSVSRILGGAVPEVLCYNEFPSAGIGHGKVMNPSRLSDALRGAIADTERYLGIKIFQAEVNLQKYDIRELDFTASIDIPPCECISNSNMEELENIAWEQARLFSEGDEVYGLVAQGFDTPDYISLSREDIIGMMTTTLVGHYKAYLGKPDMRNYIDHAFRSCGIETVRTVFAPNRVGEAVLSVSEMESGVALIDLGAGASSVSIFHGGVLRHYGAIPFGGDTVTSDIRTRVGIDARLAENIKMGYGGCLVNKMATLGDRTLKITDKNQKAKTEVRTQFLREIITARMKEIIEALLWEIQKSGYADSLKSGIVLVGGGANMLNIGTFITQISGYTARVGAPVRDCISGESSFHTPSAAASSALILDFIDRDNNKCTEKSAFAPEAQQNAVVNDVPSQGAPEPLFNGESEDASTQNETKTEKEAIKEALRAKREAEKAEKEAQRAAEKEAEKLAKAEREKEIKRRKEEAKKKKKEMKG